jgi:hypothetical protein
MYAAGLISGNEKMQEAGILTVKAVVESYMVSHVVLKNISSTTSAGKAFREV